VKGRGSRGDAQQSVLSRRASFFNEAKKQTSRVNMTKPDLAMNASYSYQFSVYIASI